MKNTNTKKVLVRDVRDGSIYECNSMSDAINLCVNDWNMEIVED